MKKRLQHTDQRIGKIVSGLGFAYIIPKLNNYLEEMTGTHAVAYRLAIV